MKIKIDQITVKENPRKDFSNVKDLAKSVKQYGLMQPIVVNKTKDGYQLIAGERRLRAAKLLNWDSIEANVMAVSDDHHAKELQMVENIDRAQLNPMEEAEGYEALLNEDYTVDKLAAKFNRPKVHIQRRLKLLDLCKTGRDAMKKGQISLEVGVVIARCPDLKLQKQLVEEAIEQSLSANSVVSRMVQFSYNLSNVQFDTAECTKCESYNGSLQVDLFTPHTDELTGKCLNKECYVKKLVAYATNLVDESGKAGFKMITTREELPENYRLVDREALGEQYSKCQGDEHGRCQHNAMAAILDGEMLRTGEICLNSRCYQKLCQKAVTPESDTVDTPNLPTEGAAKDVKDDRKTYTRCAEFVEKHLITSIHGSLEKTSSGCRLEAYIILKAASLLSSFDIVTVLEDLKLSKEDEKFPNAASVCFSTAYTEVQLAKLADAAYLQILSRMTISELAALAKFAKFDIKTFRISAEYLSKMTKAELTTFAGEVGVDVTADKKNDMVSQIMLANYKKCPAEIATFFEAI